MEPTGTWTDKVKALLQHLQFYWWGGHVYFAVNSVLYLLSLVRFHSIPAYYYHAYVGALVSYGIVGYNSTKFSDSKWWNSLVRNENVQYLVLAFYWYSYTPIAVTLIPYLVFSLFHILGYIQSVLLPTFFSKETNPKVHEYGEILKTHTEKYHELAMQIASYTDVMLIFPRLLLGVLLLQTSLLAFIVFFLFVRLRYYVSPYTQLAIRQSINMLDQWLLPTGQNSPPPSQWHAYVFNGYAWLRGILEHAFTFPSIPQEKLS
ncbi:hypothetical protein BC940DRAFT_312588 [Gongronella butleri]|nr:hypothetical protein BC940DRAFT_312588 [Gongronella butleri]